MAVTAIQPSVKVIGVNGQISLGKQYAGRQVLVEEQEAGVWLIRTATVIMYDAIKAHGKWVLGG